MKELKTAINARMILMAAGLFLLFNAVTTTSQDGLRWFNIVHLITQYDEDVASGKIQPPAKTESVESEADSVVANPDTAAEQESSDNALEESASEETDSTAESEAASAESNADTASAEPAAESEADSTEPAVETEAAASQEIDIPALKTEMETLGITLADLRLLGIACYIMTVIRILAGVVCVRFSNRVDRAGITLKTVIGLIIAEVIYLLLLFFKRALFLGSILYTALICGALLWGALKMKKLSKEDPERVYAVTPAKQRAVDKPAAPQKSLRDKAMMNTHTDLDDESDSSSE